MACAHLSKGSAIVDAQVAIVGSLSEGRAILAARDSLNAALVARDASVYAHFWLPEVQLVAGDGGARSGRDTSVATFTRSFADGSFVSGRRIPERIEVGASSSGLTQAAETGRWV